MYLLNYAMEIIIMSPEADSGGGVGGGGGERVTPCYDMPLEMDGYV